MNRDINFYIECLKRELGKPLHEQDFMYMRHLDTKIYNLNKYSNQSHSMAVQYGKKAICKT